MEEIITGLDIGTTKVCAVIAERNEEDELEILGVGVSPNYGIKKGVVVNIDSTVEAITHAIEDAELMAGHEVHSLYAGISGTHVKSHNSHGLITISGPDREVTQMDVERVIEQAQAMNISSDREILHVLPWEFKVDEHDGIIDPTGMRGVRLESQVHIITVSSTSVQNIIKSVNRAGLEVLDLVLNPIASAESVLSEDEREIGCILIDIGGGTTDVVLTYNGSVRYAGVLGLGGRIVSKDLSFGLKTSESVAEKLKITYGAIGSSLTSPNESIEIPVLGPKEFKDNRNLNKVPKHYLAEIIEPRMEELFVLVYNDLMHSGLLDLAAGGIVLTGGASMLPGSIDIAEKVFEMPVRIGAPERLKGLNDVVASPVYSTAVGLSLYGMRDPYIKENPVFSGEGFLGKMKTKISTMMKELFH